MRIGVFLLFFFFRTPTKCTSKLAKEVF